MLLRKVFSATASAVGQVEGLSVGGPVGYHAVDAWIGIGGTRICLDSHRLALRIRTWQLVH